MVENDILVTGKAYRASNDTEEVQYTRKGRSTIMLDSGHSSNSVLADQHGDPFVRILTRPTIPQELPLKFSGFDFCTSDTDEDNTDLSQISLKNFTVGSPTSRVSLFYRLYNSPMSLKQAFLTPGAAIAHGLSIPPNDAENNYVKMEFQTLNTSLEIFGRADAATPLTYGWMVLSMQFLPKAMLMKRQFQEMMAVICVDGNPIADLFLYKGFVRPQATVTDE